MRCLAWFKKTLFCRVCVWGGGDRAFTTVKLRTDIMSFVNHRLLTLNLTHYLTTNSAFLVLSPNGPLLEPVSSHRLGTHVIKMVKIVKEGAELVTGPGGFTW